MIVANIKVYKQAIDLQTSFSAGHGEYINNIVKMDATLVQAGQTFAGLSPTYKSSLVAKNADFAANVAPYDAAVLAVEAATVAVKFDTDGVTIINV